MNAAPLKKWLPRLALALITAWPLLIITRGFDLTDSGYYLFSYRYAFAWPEVNSLTMVLSNWLGGLICALLPETGQILALRVLCVGIYALVTWFSYVILREHFPAWLNIGALALASAFPIALIYITSYNSFSYLFLSLAILLLYRGLEKDKPRFLYLAAIILGLNPFVRLPNVLQWGLLAVPFWYYWFGLGRRGRAVSLTLRFVLVTLLTWLAFFGLVRLGLGAAVVDQAINDLMDSLFLSQQRHSAFAMWDIYDLILRDGFKLVALSAPLWALTLILGGLLAFFGHRPRAALLLAALGLAAGTAYALIGGEFHYVHLFRSPFWARPLTGLTMYLAAAGPLIALAGLLWYHQRRPLLSALSGAAIVIFLALPFGSDYSALHYLYYLHLALPVCLGLIHRLWLDGWVWLKESLPRLRLREPGWPALVGINVFLWFFLAVHLRALNDLVLTQAHGDAPRAAATAPVSGAPELWGLKTHPGRAWWLNDLARQTAPYADLPLAVLGQCPLCYFLSQSKPLLPWPWLDLAILPPLRVKQGLEEAARAGRLPLVLIVNQKFDPWSVDWRNRSNENVFKFFMEEHRYTLAVDRPAYQLFLPPGRGQGAPVKFPRPARRPGRGGPPPAAPGQTWPAQPIAGPDIKKHG